MEVRGLSARETALLSEWERARRQRITLAELERSLGANAKVIAKRMAKKGALERVGRGVYAIRPLRSLVRRTSWSSPVLTAHLLADEAYYLGGLWALTFHRLTTQQYTSALDAFVTKRRRARVLGHARVTFHLAGAERFAYGITAERIEETAVKISDPARTLLDLLDYPELAGGLPAALAHVTDALPRVDAPLLVGHAIRGSRLSTCQRLGLLLSRAGVSERKLAPLLKHARKTASRLSLVPGEPRRGPLNERWNVIENDVPRAAR